MYNGYVITIEGGGLLSTSTTTCPTTQHIVLNDANDKQDHDMSRTVLSPPHHFCSPLQFPKGVEQNSNV